MANRWVNNRNSERLFLGAPKSLQMVTAAMKLKDTCSLEEKFWPTYTAYQKAETLLCQQRKVRLVKAMVFPVAMYGCESWTIKTAEHRRIDAFELWCWRLLRVLWTARRSNQSILKEISPKIFIGRTDVEAQTPILWPPDTKNWLIWKDLDAGKDWRQEEKETTGWDGWMASPTQWTWVWVGSGSWWWTGRPGMLQCMGSQRVRHDWMTELNWTVLAMIIPLRCLQEVKTG